MKNRSTLVDKILSGKKLDDQELYPSIKDTEDLYASLFESPSPSDHHAIHDHKAATETFTPITAEEVAAAKKTWRRSAPGLDGIEVDTVAKMDNAKLAALFSIIYATAVQPPSWQLLRTTLIYKDGDRRNPSNWRPITIGSTVQRLMHRILASRLKNSVTLDVNQRGFIEIDGTLGNVMLVEQYINNRKSTGKPYNVVSLDIRKAFDTVSHESLVRALHRHGLNQGTITYIESTLANTSTTIKVGSQVSRRISVNRGVRQGDPLSPLLFNLVVDELLESLNGQRAFGGTIITGVQLSAVAFADDIIIIEDNEAKVPLLLRKAEEFFRHRGMEINPSKCSSLIAAARNKTIIPRSEATLTLNGHKIKPISGHATFKYLGHQYSGSGINKPTLANLPKWLNNLAKAPLKPDQRLRIIVDYIVPKILYGLQNPRITGKILREADRLIKHHVKRALHLSSHTPDQYLYGKVRDGGLGITELRSHIPRYLLGRLNKLLESQDAILNAVLQTEESRKLFRRLESLTGPVPPDQIWKQRIAEAPFSKGLENTSDDSASRAWIGNKPTGWTGRDYVRAIQLRTNNLPTVGLPSNPTGNRACRGGCHKVESISHVLQACPVTHWERIHRHNEIVHKIKTHCVKHKWPVEEEPHVRHPDGTLFKPDLVIHRGDQTIVCDVQVSWEGNVPLGVSHNNKRLVYDNPKFNAAAIKRWPGKPITHSPLIIGARGIWPRCNAQTEEILQLTSSVKQSCVHSALKWGSTIHRAFMRSVWKRHGSRNTN